MTRCGHNPAQASTHVIFRVHHDDELTTHVPVFLSVIPFFDASYDYSIRSFNCKKMLWFYLTSDEVNAKMVKIVANSYHCHYMEYYQIFRFFRSGSIASRVHEWDPSSTCMRCQSRPAIRFLGSWCSLDSFPARRFHCKLAGGSLPLKVVSVRPAFVRCKVFRSPHWFTTYQSR